ncbi:unnamed protein product [Microthlaspi erraticum]|uniref:F-box domain-containing protein n=1 Tax=Microthlaspi erraticum TaxID=1685480 RepID=A0A6D2K3E6_9BRAS|nr:unnamed protein product [Microthlaspi erraticum]CAA7042338.1 unnamed protein product [Microthlaspi erraticum]CAA7043902.1 unnamed protein product [Microthlaspi erraticum]
MSSDINIPLDLTVEILKKLPAKSLARFRSVSTEWERIINKFIVINSIVTRCLTTPPRDLHLILNRRSSSEFTNLSYSFLYPQITNEEQLYNEYIFENSKGYDFRTSFQYVRGLIGFQCSGNGPFRIHNPTTRQFVSLPVTCLPATCIYLFGSEVFDHIQSPEDLPVHRLDFTLVNYQEKLGCMCCNQLNKNDVDMWVMENAEKQEWSKVTFVAMLQDLPKAITFAGVTHPGGEMVFVPQAYSNTLASEVYYYDPKRNSSRIAKVQTTTSLLEIEPRDNVRIWAVTDHVENIMHL